METEEWNKNDYKQYGTKIINKQIEENKKITIMFFVTTKIDTEEICKKY